MNAILYAALFFETSTEEECDPDLAVKQLEGIAWSLRQLSSAEQDQFRSYARRVADADPALAVADEIRTLVGVYFLPTTTTERRASFPNPGPPERFVP